jgi:hypothetical protein
MQPVRASAIANGRPLMFCCVTDMSVSSWYPLVPDTDYRNDNGNDSKRNSKTDSNFVGLGKM